MSRDDLETTVVDRRLARAGGVNAQALVGLIDAQHRQLLAAPRKYFFGHVQSDSASLAGFLTARVRPSGQ
jgi:hypothetical protein